MLIKTQRIGYIVLSEAISVPKLDNVVKATKGDVQSQGAAAAAAEPALTARR